LGISVHTSVPLVQYNVQQRGTNSFQSPSSAPFVVIISLFWKIISGTSRTKINVLLLQVHRAESPRRQCIYQDTLELWVVSMEISSCHPCGAKNLKVFLRFLENV
jgi:hypothetical protein